MGGRPGFLGLDFHRQYSLNPIRCHVMTVSGRTITSADRQFGQSLESHTQKTRSPTRLAVYAGYYDFRNNHADPIKDTDPWGRKSD
jgi:hypothetical protein